MVLAYRQIKETLEMFLKRKKRPCRKKKNSGTPQIKCHIQSIQHCIFKSVPRKKDTLKKKKKSYFYFFDPLFERTEVHGRNVHQWPEMF